jgi:hypothetical protein
VFRVVFESFSSSSSFSVVFRLAGTGEDGTKDDDDDDDDCGMTLNTYKRPALPGPSGRVRLTK